MTIKVTVTNSDSRESAIIRVQQTNLDGSPIGPTLNLKGGESTDVYVHGTQNISVVEVSQ